MPHRGLVFGSLRKDDLVGGRVAIAGVSPRWIKYLGNHKDVQEWDFIELDGRLVLLVPKRYVILSRGKILSICLIFES